MAGNDQGNWVRGHAVAYSPGCARGPGLGRQLSITSGLAVRDCAARLVDPLAEFAARGQLDRHVAQVIGPSRGVLADATGQASRPGGRDDIAPLEPDCGESLGTAGVPETQLAEMRAFTQQDNPPQGAWKDFGKRFLHGVNFHSDKHLRSVRHDRRPDPSGL